MRMWENKKDTNKDGRSEIIGLFGPSQKMGVKNL